MIMLAARAMRASLAMLAAIAVGLAAQVHAADKKPEIAGPYVPTPWIIVDEILKLGGVGPNDFVVDLGSGDGRLVLTAATRFKARGGFGVDIEPALVKEANDSARKQGIGDRVKFYVRDLFETDVAEASVVTLYLLPTSVPKLQPKLLAELKPGSRVVSHDYPFPDWPHERYVKMDVPEKIAISGTTRTTLYLYIVPARIGGDWDLKLPASLTKSPLKLAVTQAPGGATARVRSGERTLPASEISVRATDVTITLPAGIAGQKALTLRGKAGEGVIEGTIDGARWRAVRAPT